MEEVFIIGVGMNRFGKYPKCSYTDLAREAIDRALVDAGIEKKDIQAVWFANSGWGRRAGQDCIRGQVALRPLGIQGIPIVNVENACAGGSTAFHDAWLSVKAGVYDVVMAIGVEKIFHKDKFQMFASFLTGMDTTDIPGILNRWREYESKLSISSKFPDERKSRKKKNLFKNLSDNIKEIPNLIKNLIVLSNFYGWENVKLLIKTNAGADKSPFMDVYSLAARWHMQKYGSTQRQLAVISSKNHFHGSLNPLAQYQKAMTVEEVLKDVPVSYPLTRAMCAPIGDGASSAILCSKNFLKKLTNPREVLIRACVLGSGMEREMEDEDIGKRLAKKAYDMASVGPQDIDIAELHDATAFGELHHSETLGFCSEGEGGRFAESGATTLGGKIPINTSGGLECRGHPIAASGLAQIYELVLQLRQEAGKRQVQGARLALAQNGGGNIGVEEAAMVISILEKKR